MSKETSGLYQSLLGLSWWLRWLKKKKKSACNERDLALIPGLGRSPEEGNGNPVQSSYLKNSKDREAWLVTVHGLAKSQT